MTKDIKILVVEDNEDINKLLCDMLTQSQYITKSAYSGTEALIYLKEYDWDMILLDLMLPGMDGKELLANIRKSKPMPVIIISAKEEKDIKIETLRMGADDYITKPFDIDEVYARIDSHLIRYKPTFMLMDIGVVYPSVQNTHHIIMTCIALIIVSSCLGMYIFKREDIK
nr:response regulator transcription factor [Clostridium sporogenes]